MANEVDTHTHRPIHTYYIYKHREITYVYIYMHVRKIVMPTIVRRKTRIKLEEHRPGVVIGWAGIRGFGLPGFGA